MMKITGRIATALFAGALLAAPAMSMAQYGNGYGQGPRGWDAPPANYRQQVQQDAFRAGLDGARKDLENHRRPDVNNRDEYRNYRGPNRRAYQIAFQRGYQTFWSHQGGPGRRY